MPIHKPLDRVSKAFVDEAPRLFLHALGVVPLDAEGVALEFLPLEIAPPVVLPDVAIRIVRPGCDPFIFHAEFEGRFRALKLPTVALYGGGLIAQYRVPVQTVILLLVPSRSPDYDQGLAVYSVGETAIRHPFRVVRLWELDPSPLLKSKDPRVFPWARLMKSSDAEVQAIAAELSKLGDEELLGRFYMLGGVRYHKRELLEMTGGPRMSLAEVLWEESSVLQPLRARVTAESLAKGRQEGARQLLGAALSAKFPGLESLPELERIEDVEALEQILIQYVVGGSDRAAVEQAIRNAAAQSEK